MRHKLALLLLLSAMALVESRPLLASRPLLGAEIWIEPGQSPSQIDAWFRDLSDSHMSVARLFLMWPYVESAPKEWNFAHYDTAFRAAEKYHIRIVATLTPNALPTFL